MSEDRKWFFVPTELEWERMRKYAQPHSDRCPKCGKGRVVIEVFSGRFAQVMSLVCRWGIEGCDFKEGIADGSQF